MATMSDRPGLFSRLFGRTKPELEPEPQRHIHDEEAWLSPLYERDAQDESDFPPTPPQHPHLYPPFAVAGETLPLPPAPKKHTRGWWISRGIAAFLFLFILIVGWLLVTAPLSKSLQPIAPPEITLLAADGTPIARNGAVVAAPVEVKKLPPHVVDAFIAIEDRRFYSHWGIDPRGIARAVWSNITRGKTQGGSTITQQLAKFTFLTPEQNLGRKAREALIALWLEAWLTKDQILERYLSNAYFGDNCYGLRAASMHYFYRQPEKLRPEQAAMLAGMLKAPSAYAPTQHPQAAEKRMRVVLQTMVETGYLTQAEIDRMPTPHVDVREAGDDLPTGTYFADWALPQARRLSEVGYSRQTITTTLDSRLQAAARNAINRAALGKAQVALVAMRPNGEVVAMIGGKDYEKSPFNRATQARRQPGSTFKLFVYLAALEKGWRPDDTIDNSQITTGSYRPSNASGNYSPTITLEDAFARSSNVAAVRLLRDVGDDAVIRVARKLGVASPLAEGDPSLALGTSTMTLMELTAAYAGVAANEFPAQPRAFTAEEPGWFDWLWSSKSSLSSREHDDMEDLLRGAINHGTGRAAMLNVANFGKTGTTQDNRDALFIGYAGGLVVGVWIGNDDNTPLGNVHGGSVPARIWRDFMAQALGSKAVPGPSRPSPSPNPSGPIVPLDIPNLDDLPLGDTKLKLDPNGASITTSIDGKPVDVRIDQNGLRLEPSPKPSAQLQGAAP
ncbi:MAG: transglycosylase domain-containing protein [Candidatus Andeanibacterium colombiense]|uniref:Transglycosylase domain-containing protein n=1 Tax=Candidatus Andeanibacterium colombiense TaxID=3121345 RepID=A0AAJ5X7Z1_9SPHN|nr:MAG: transglycosylase domain-containing protein [Sphingomonadaceae bacterium]